MSLWRLLTRGTATDWIEAAVIGAWVWSMIVAGEFALAVIAALGGGFSEPVL